jgi:hypothetical protein
MTSPSLPSLRDELVRALEARVDVAMAPLENADESAVTPLLAALIATRHVAGELLEVEASLARSPSQPALKARADLLRAHLEGLIRNLQSAA